MKIRRGRQGIVMVIALFSLTTVTMLVAATMTLMPGDLLAGRHGGESGQALRAAESGLDYAQARLQENPAWIGSPVTELVVDTPALKVVEHRGNVIGVLTAPDGSRSAFRLRFNYQNGSDAPDEGLGNPTSQYQIRSPHLSTNNLEGATGCLVYPIDSSWRVPAGAISTVSIPHAMVELKVEGFSGGGLATATPENLDTLVFANRGIVRRGVQSRLSIMGLAGVDSAVAAGEDFLPSATGAALSMGMGVVRVREADGAPRAKVRSLSNVTVSGHYDTSQNSKVVIDEAGGKAFTFTGMTPAEVEQATAEQQQGHFLKMSWDDVPKADTSNTRLKAGTYVWRESSAGGPELAYFAENYTGSIPTGTGSIIGSEGDLVDGGLSSGLTLDRSQLKLSISDKILVSAQGAVTDLAILIDPDLQDDMRKRPMLSLESGALGGNDALLTAPGNFTIQGSSEGYGSIVTSGNMSLQGSSLIEADPDGSVALYSRGDINIEAIPSVVTAEIELSGGAMGMLSPGMGMGAPGGFNPMGMSMSMSMGTPELSVDFTVGGGDVSFAGLIYTQGNFKANVPNGAFYMRGILTAFGADPALNQQPGFGGKGRVKVDSENARFIYDPSYLQQLINPGQPTRLERVSWNLL